MNMMTSVERTPPAPPLAILRALPPGPLAKKWAHLENARRLAPLFAAFDRDDMELAVDLLLAEMDAQDGDSDIESNGDESDYSGGVRVEDVPEIWLPAEYRFAAATLADAGDLDDVEQGLAEDEFAEHRSDNAAGCPVADPDHGIDDTGEMTVLDDGELTSAETNGERQGEPGFYSADDHDEPDGAAIRRPYRDAIRNTRCEPIRRHWGVEGYYLRSL